MDAQAEPESSTRRSAHEIYEKVKDNARSELDRSPHALAFSGAAGGFAMGLTGLAAKGLTVRWRERIDAQRDLRDHIALWAGHRKAEGMTDSEMYRRFYWRFGVDVMTAQTLGRAEAEQLTANIEDALDR